MELQIPVAYQASASAATNWEITRKGLQITALHDKIGVKAIMRSNEKEGTLIALPDDVTGTEYRGNNIRKFLSFTTCTNLKLWMVSWE